MNFNSSKQTIYTRRMNVARKQDAITLVVIMKLFSTATTPTTYAYMYIAKRGIQIL